jgi:hypothetical protein
MVPIEINEDQGEKNVRFYFRPVDYLNPSFIFLLVKNILNENLNFVCGINFDSSICVDDWSVMF